MRFNKKILYFLFILVIISSTVIYTSIAQNETEHDTLVISLGGEIPEIDFRVYNNRLVEWISLQYQGFLGMSAPGKTTVTLPGIAESWIHNENRTEWTFTLREGSKFHDNSTIDAKAVKYSIEANTLLNRNLDNMSHAAEVLATDGMVKYMGGVDISFPPADPNGVGRVVIFSGDYFPDAMFEWDFSGMWKLFPLFPYGSHGSYSDNTTTCQEKIKEFTRHPISAGPYKVNEWNISKYILLERFDDWFGWGQTFNASNSDIYTFPTLEKAFQYVNFSVIFDNQLETEKLTTGEIDVIPDLDVDRKTRDELNSTKGYSVIQVPKLGMDSIEMNTQGNWPTIYGGPGNFPLSQVWFRQAVSHAINRTYQVETTYHGTGTIRNKWFPGFIEELFPNLDTTDYYNFDQGRSETIRLLDEAGYEPLGFSEEPTNRFGWGLYANETQIDGVEQTKGRHFDLLSIFGTDWATQRTSGIKHDLEQVGIYVDVHEYDWNTYVAKLYDGDSGLSYNTTAPQPDLNFNGPSWDFSVGGYAGNYQTPWDYIGYREFAYWLFYGRTNNDWYNLDYEIAYAKATDGVGTLMYIPGVILPSNYPYPFPEWSNEDLQFVEACEEAGYQMAKELPYIPLTNYRHTYAINDHLKNFLISPVVGFSVAYSYWSPSPKTSPVLEFDLVIISLIVLLPFLHRIRKKSKVGKK